MNGRRAVACVIEGHGEKESLPILIRRVAAEFDPPVHVDIPIVIRVNRSKLLKPDELEKAVELAARRIGPSGAVFVLLDADDDCPARLGPALLGRARTARSDRKVSVVLAKREFEAWFLAAARSLAGKRGLASDMTPPPDPEDVRGAKEWLNQRKTDGTSYSPVIDQPKLTAAFSMDEALRCGSFDKCRREIRRLLADQS